MKLPRWLVIVMLTSSGLTVPATAWWWWVTWPERTAREFVELMAAKKFEEVDARLGWNADYISRVYAGQVAGEAWKQSNLKGQPCSTFDVITGRQNFKATGSDEILFIIQRGKVVQGPPLRLIFEFYAQVHQSQKEQDPNLRGSNRDAM